MSQVNVLIVIQPGAAMYLPHPVQGNPEDLIIWSIDSGGAGWQFQDSGGVAVLDNNPPPGFTSWSGNQPQPGDGGTYWAVMPPLPDNAPPEGVKYRYTFNLVNPTTSATFHWDPDLENHPGT